MMKRWAFLKKSQRAFTIVELLIVIVVIGVLAAIVVVGYGAVQNNAHDASIKSDLTKFGEAVNLKALDDQVIPKGGATSSLAGDSTVFPGVNVVPNRDVYDQAVANFYYCEGFIDNNDEFAFVARSISGKVFKYLSAGGISEITTPLTWSTANNPSVCTAAGFSGPFTWSYGYNPDPELQWFDWTQEGENQDVVDPPIAWWRFNGDATDSIGTAHGTVSGATLTADRNSTANYAYHFDGVDDYIEVPPVLSDYNAFTISAWARVKGGPTANTGWGYVIHQGPAATQGTSNFWIAGQNGGYGVYSADVSGVGDVSHRSTNIISNTTSWHFLTLVYDGTTRSIYADGVLEVAYEVAFTNPVTSPRVGIGGSPYNPTYRPAIGDIDDVRIYDRTLTADEVLQLYNIGPK